MQTQKNRIKPRSLPFSWQRALVAYALQTGVTLYSNSVLWGHIDSLNHPYAFWLKAGLLGIVDLAGFVLVTWHLFSRVVETRTVCFVLALILMLTVLVHTGGVAGYEGSKGEKLAMLSAMAEGQAKIAQAQTEAAVKATSEGAMKANASGQRSLARSITKQGQATVAGANADAQRAFLERAERAKPESFLPESYMRGAMYWFLMGLAGCFVMAALWVTEKSGHVEDANANGIPDELEDALEQLFGARREAMSEPRGKEPQRRLPAPMRRPLLRSAISTNAAPTKEESQPGRSREAAIASTPEPMTETANASTPIPSNKKPVVKWMGNRIISDERKEPRGN